jgi:hypothetical protein
LEFLSCVLRADIMRALDSPEQVQAFDFASERLRVALRKVVEPDVEPEEPDEEPYEEPDEEPDNNDTWKRTPPRRSGNSRRSRRNLSPAELSQALQVATAAAERQALRPH